MKEFEIWGMHNAMCCCLPQKNCRSKEVAASPRRNKLSPHTISHILKATGSHREGTFLKILAMSAQQLPAPEAFASHWIWAEAGVDPVLLDCLWEYTTHRETKGRGSWYAGWYARLSSCPQMNDKAVGNSEYDSHHEGEHERKWRFGGSCPEEQAQAPAYDGKWQVYWNLFFAF